MREAPNSVGLIYVKKSSDLNTFGHYIFLGGEFGTSII